MVPTSETEWYRELFEELQKPTREQGPPEFVWMARIWLGAHSLTWSGANRRIEIARAEAANAADTDHIDIVASAQDLLEALGYVAQIAQGVRYEERLLDLEILSALGEGVKQYEVAAAAGKDSQIVRRWRDRAARFVMKLVKDARLMGSSEERFLACECGENFQLAEYSSRFCPKEYEFIGAYSAISRHWKTQHGWNPTADDDDARNAADYDLLSQKAVFEEAHHEEAHHEREHRSAASGHVEVLVALTPGLLPETITVLKGLAEDADEKFSVLGEHSRRSQRQSERLTRIAWNSRELTEQEQSLKVATGLVRNLNAKAKQKRTKSVTRAIIAKAAGVAPATVTRWADETDSLIRRISSGMLHIPDSTADACSLCEERFTWHYSTGGTAAAIYRHWLEHHPTEEQSETPEQAKETHRTAEEAEGGHSVGPRPKRWGRRRTVKTKNGDDGD